MRRAARGLELIQKFFRLDAVQQEWCGTSAVPAPNIWWHASRQRQKNLDARSRAVAECHDPTSLKDIQWYVLRNTVDVRYLSLSRMVVDGVTTRRSIMFLASSVDSMVSVSGVTVVEQRVLVAM